MAVSPKACAAMVARQTPITSLCLDLTYWRGYHAGMRFSQENWSDPSAAGKGPPRSARSIHGPSGSYALAKALKASLDEIEEENAAPTATCVHVGGDKFDLWRFTHMMYEQYGIVTSGGSPTREDGSYVGFRVGTMGQSASAEYVFAFLAALEDLMPRLGYKVNCE